ncbi:MAG: sigma-54-dependent Fis family transcriptional regulator [Myxococcales bacterium]|nr:sigma-54-dependent Fis family transcriptional regulator [Myxococcales bacterium]
MRELDWHRYDVLVVDDEQDNLDAFRFAFRKAFRLVFAHGALEAQKILSAFEPAVVVADQRMPSVSGIELLRESKVRWPDTYCILLTAYADVDVLVEAVNTGAVDRYVQKPWDQKELDLVLRQAIGAYETLRENRRMRAQLAEYTGYLERGQRDALDFGMLFAPSGASVEVARRVAEIAPTATTVLIEGDAALEHGVVAHALHVGSSREGRPFVQVACAAFRGDALERELFGWCRGAHEEAFIDRAGRVELADGGTLWLDGLEEPTAQLEARLLRLLREGVVERLGETTLRRVDVRLVVSMRSPGPDGSTCRPMLQELEASLSVHRISLRPLVERKGELAELAATALLKFRHKNPMVATSLSAAAAERLSAHDWPGNLRELERVIERAAVVAGRGVIEPEHLVFETDLRGPARSRGAAAALVDSLPSRPVGVGLAGRLDALERGELLEALKASGGNKAEVARVLGVQRTTLYYRLKKHGLDG